MKLSLEQEEQSLENIKKLKKINFVYILVTFMMLSLFIIMFSDNSQGVGVSPLVINLEMKPGETEEFEFVLLPSSSASEQIEISIYQPVQTPDGGMVYLKPDPDDFPVLKWVTLQKDSFLVKGDSNVTVKGEVKAPYGTGGSHTIILMIEPESAQGKSGITFRFRYAIRLNIRVQSPGLRASAEMEKNWGLVRDEDGNPLLQVMLHNKSAWDYLVTGEASIRNEQGMLVERVKLQSPVAINSGFDQTRIYPGSTVKHIAALDNLTKPGTYTVRVFFKYGDYGQLIKRKEIEIEPGDFEFPEADTAGAFSVTPASLNLTLNPGQSKTEVLELTTSVEERLQLAITLKEIESEYKYSVLEMVQLRSNPQFALTPHSKGRAVLTFAVPRDVKSGSYHGFVEFKVYSPGTDESLTRKLIPLSVLIKDGNFDIDIKSLHLAKEEEGYLLSLTLFNKGNTLLTPEVELKIMDEEDNLLEKLILNLPEDINMIIPQKEGRVVGNIKNELEAGKYRAVITINNRNEVLKTGEKTFFIEEGKNGDEEEEDL